MLRRVLSGAKRRLGLAPPPPPPPVDAGPPIYYFVESTVASPFNTGIQRVARQFARALIELGYPLIPVKWGGPLQPFHPVSEAQLEHFANWNGPPPEAWRPWRPWPDQAGGWFVMAELPVHLSPRQQAVLREAAGSAGLNTAAVFYDAIPWKMGDLYPEAVAQAHLAYMAELGLYDRVLAISEHSRGDLAQGLQGACGRGAEALGHIQACPLPAEFPNVPRAGAPRPGKAAEGPVQILCVGSVEPRKNHERLLLAFDLARAEGGPPLALTIVGGPHGLDPGLAGRVRARVEADPDVTWLEDATDAQVAALYEACDFTVYPSIEEGFGMPILESLWCGKPVVCADFGAMAEVAEGGGCLTADTRDPAALARALAELAKDAGLRARLAEEAARRRFRSWRDYALDAAALLELKPPGA